MRRPAETKHRGFTLIELLIVVAIIGILAAIAIPNLLNALQRARQKRTMADIRSVATAWEAYSVAQSSFAPAAWTQLDGATPQSYSGLAGAIAPTYIQKLPEMDGWNRPFRFRISGDTRSYEIGSQGADGQFNSTDQDGATTNFDCDIIYQNGSFMVYPNGAQQQ